ncbi:MAG: hypothetical protein D6E12_17125 [Desulfovibrio sp.]|nr:MAG: hypothetical protein D6E12_17125 [Desulfovibrio sp.]
MDKIFVRERSKAIEGDKRPRYRVIGTSGAIKITAKHVRKLEIEEIAKQTGCEVVYLDRDKEGKGKP